GDGAAADDRRACRVRDLVAGAGTGGADARTAAAALHTDRTADGQRHHAGVLCRRQRDAASFDRRIVDQRRDRVADLVFAGRDADRDSGAAAAALHADADAAGVGDDVGLIGRADAERTACRHFVAVANRGRDRVVRRVVGPGPGD